MANTPKSTDGAKPGLTLKEIQVECKRRAITRLIISFYDTTLVVPCEAKGKPFNYLCPATDLETALVNAIGYI